MSLDAISIGTYGNQFLKTKYASSYTSILPSDDQYISKQVGNLPAVKIGSDFEACVALVYGQSVTARGNKEQILNLNVPIIQPLQTASATSFIFTYRELLSTGMLERARASGDTAFGNIVDMSMDLSKQSFTKILEEVYLYGQRGIGTFTGVTADLNNRQVQIDIQEYAQGIWTASTGMPLSVYTTAGLLILNTSLESYDATNRKLTLTSVTGLSNGTAYKIYRTGFYGNEPIGLEGILRANTTLFGIDATGKWDLWAPSITDCGGAPLTYPKIIKGIGQNTARGLSRRLKMFVSPFVFNDLLPDYNTTVSTNSSPGPRAARMFMDKNDELKIVHGTESLKYIVNSCEIELEVSSMQKAGIASTIDPSTFVRLTNGPEEFKLVPLNGISGAGPASYFMGNENMATCEYRLEADTALFTSARNKNMIFTNITPSNYPGQS